MLPPPLGVRVAPVLIQPPERQSPPVEAEFGEFLLAFPMLKSRLCDELRQSGGQSGRWSVGRREPPDWRKLPPLHVERPSGRWDILRRESCRRDLTVAL